MIFDLTYLIQEICAGHAKKSRYIAFNHKLYHQLTITSSEYLSKEFEILSIHSTHMIIEEVSSNLIIL